MTADYYNGLPPGGDTVTGGQPFVFKRGAMTMQKQLNFKEFDHLILAPRAMRDWGMDEGAQYIISDLLGQGAGADDIIRHMLELFPTWGGRAKEMKLIVECISDGGME